jgi:hypothetical protein
MSLRPFPPCFFPEGPNQDVSRYIRKVCQWPMNRGLWNTHSPCQVSRWREWPFLHLYTIVYLTRSGLAVSMLSCLPPVQLISLTYFITLKYATIVDPMSTINYSWIAKAENPYLLRNGQIDRRSIPHDDFEHHKCSVLRSYLCLLISR